MNDIKTIDDVPSVILAHLAGSYCSAAHDAVEMGEHARASGCVRRATVVTGVLHKRGEPGVGFMFRWITTLRRRIVAAGVAVEHPTASDAHDVLWSAAIMMRE